ncbi:MAG: hypothetical protein FJX63_11165 [Alphaproteobacteria bacterium]|nr:hypothetical protein [Alphaproteobacteria bacterium]
MSRTPMCRTSMGRSTLAIAALALLATGFPSGEAAAGSKWKRWFFIEDSYNYEPEPGLTPEEFVSLYGDDFDESYYEPNVDPAPKKKVTKKKTATGTATKPKKPTTASTTTKATTTKATTTETTTKTATVKPKAETAAADEGDVALPKGALTCAKAEGIVTGYGFTAVKASDCDGQVYAFNAMRDGKPYAIKLSAANGELTEVRKVQ